jgi:hypothetical protein
VSHRVRSAGLLLVGAISLHWLRYLFSYGHSAGEELHRQGHGYLSELLPGLLALCLVLLGISLVIGAIGRSSAGAAGSRLWAALTFAAAVLAIYGAQELAEGVFADGHHAGLQAVLADSGWVALPIALAIGAALCWLERLLMRAERHLGVLMGSAAPRRRPPSASDPVTPFVPRLAVLALAFGLARRPPPVPLSI